MPYSRLILSLGLTLTTGITAALLYLILRKDEETDYEGGTRSSRTTVISVKVPKDCIGTVIGRGGCNIKQIQDKSGARINCSDQVSDEKFRNVTIRGTPDSAQLAESMIHEIIMNQPLIISHEMLVPARACGRIIGKGGETIRGIIQASGARINVDSTGDNEQAQRRILLKGTAEQIALAQSLIEEQVEEDSDLRRRVEMSAANRTPRKEPKENFNYLMAASNDQVAQSSPYRTEKFNADGFIDVFVSAVENPGQFWVQLVSQRGVELDQLVDKMTEYYTKPENLKIHALTELSVGQIVAAPFDHDDKWYRAEVTKIEENEYDPAESKITLYYGDYGDTSIMRRKQLFDLRTDFLTLYFQAIECSLARVKPLGDEWSNAASDCFEELAEVAQWRKKLAHVITYRENSLKQGQRASSPVPVIELHDMEKGINIGEALVNGGLAQWENSTPPQSESGMSARLNLPQSSVKAEQEKTISSKLSGTDYTLPNGSETKDSASTSFIKKERSKAEGGGFRPKTLEKPKKKQSSKTINSPQSHRFLPEALSDEDSDEDGFSLG